MTVTRIGIALKINLILLLVVLALGATMGGFFVAEQARTMRAALDRRIGIFGGYLSRSIAGAAASDDVGAMARALQAASLDEEIAYLMIKSPDGEVRAARWVKRGGGAVVEHAFPVHAPPPGNGAAREIDTFRETVPRPAGPVIGTLAIGVDVSPERAAVNRLARKTVLAVAANALLALLLGLLFVRYLLRRPVASLLEGIRGLGAGDLSRRIELDRADEMGEIGRAFNEMAEQLSTTLVTTQELEGVVRKRTAELQEALDERIKLQNQLMQSQKLEGIALLAGGIAHDFNNLLTPILGYAQIARDRLPEGHPARKEIAVVLESAERAAGLTRQILAFSRKQRLEMRVLDLNSEILTTGKMLQRMIGEDIEVRLELAADLPRVKADPSQIQQVTLNLAVNARDAMPQGGTLTIQTSEIEIEDPDGWPGRGLVAGKYVVLSLSDTGGGMDEETLRHLFEPFFTTKGPGKGTGLGLSTVYGIVKQHGGDISVYSEPGRGTVFRIYLPSAGSEPEAPAEAEQPPPTGSGRVLLVEDDDAVRELARHILAEHGYTVTCAAGPADAVAEAGRSPFDLLVSDVVMPGMNGVELSRRIAEIRPGIRILFVSGYPAGSVTLKGLLADDAPLLLKPFSVRSLTEKVRDVMRAGGAAAVPGA